MHRSKTNSTIISYHAGPEYRVTTARDLHRRLSAAGRSVYWNNIFAHNDDPTFVFLVLLWYALYAWDETLEALYAHICSLVRSSFDVNRHFSHQQIGSSCHPHKWHKPHSRITYHTGASSALRYTSWWIQEDRYIRLGNAESSTGWYRAVLTRGKVALGTALETRVREPLEGNPQTWGQQVNAEHEVAECYESCACCLIPPSFIRLILFARDSIMSISKIVDIWVGWGKLQSKIVPVIYASRKLLYQLCSSQLVVQRWNR